MEIVLKVKSENYQKVREILLKDDIISRASIIFKDGNQFGFENFYLIYISGTDEQIKKAIGVTKDLAEKLEEEKEKDVIKKLKEESEKAIEGFGSILG